MCGVFGIIKTNMLAAPEKEAFTRLSYLSSTRGIDSTGYLGLRFNTQSGLQDNVLKSALDPIAFSKTLEAQKFLERFGFKALMGHTRLKTRGDVVSANAHPFRSRDNRFVLFHNGTLNNAHAGYDTDSEWLCNRIAQHKGDLSEALNGIWGAYTLILYDKELQKISILRNKERPLSYYKGDDGIVYASEPWMLNSLGIKSTDIKELVTSADKHEVLTVTYNEKGEGVVGFEELNIRRFSYGYGHNSHASAWRNQFGDFFDDWPEDDDKSTKPEGNAYGSQQTKENREVKRIAPIRPIEQIPVQKATKAKNKIAANDQVEFLMPSRDLDGNVWDFDSLKELGYNNDQVGVILSMEEDFEVRIEAGIETVYARTSSGDWLKIEDYISAVCDGCSYCGSGGLNIAPEKKIWYGRREFLCEVCENHNKVDINRLN